MPQYKKILVALPLETLADIDELSLVDKVSRSEFIRQGLVEYVSNKRREKIREELKKRVY